MIIRVKVKTFADNEKRGRQRKNDHTEKFNDLRDLAKVKKKIEEGKNPTDAERPIADKIRNRGGGRNGRLRRANDRIKHRIENIKLKEDLAREQEKLHDLRHPKPTPPPPDTRDKAEKIRDKVKETLENPKLKKGAKIAGLSTLGAGLVAGSVIGGIKLKRKLDEKRANKKIKESISEDPEENNE